MGVEIAGAMTSPESKMMMAILLFQVPAKHRMRSVANSSVYKKMTMFKNNSELP